MLNIEFCEFLEYEITKAFKNSSNDEVKGFWCDGILLPNSENEYSKKFINDNRKVVMTAFLGLSGQDKYQLILNFGNKALSNYAKDLQITDCIQNIESSSLVNIEKRKISIQLM